MKKLLTLLALLVSTMGAFADSTVSPRGHLFSPTDPHIQYVGRISFLNPQRPAWNLPGVQMNVCFEGTTLSMMCKPGSGYFMARIDDAEPFKVAFRGKRDSIVTLCTALPAGRHTARVMYVIEGFDMHPELWGFITDGQLVDAPSLPVRKIEFIGNSITCGYGNECTNPHEGFSYETENHYYGYAQLTARQLDAVAYVVARSGIGVYRNYGEARTGSPDNNMPVQYEYTLYAGQSAWRQQGGSMAERWDFGRYQPDVVCINLGTNDLSTNNYDTKLLKQGYQKLLTMVRNHNPQARIVFLTGSMLGGRELDVCRRLLNEVADEARCAGDAHVYRFDMSPQGSLGYGADWHPSLAQHQKMADELTAYLKKLMNW